MLKVLGFLFAGIAAGWLGRKWKALRHSGIVVNVTVWLLLFLLGAEIGSDEGVTGNLLSIGGQALVFALAGVVGSAVAACLLWRAAFRKKDGGEEHEG